MIIKDIRWKLHQFNRFELPITRRKTYYCEQIDLYRKRGIKIIFRSLDLNFVIKDEKITIENNFQQNKSSGEYIHI